MSTVMSKQPKLRPKTNIPGFPDAMYDFSTISSLSHLDSRGGLGDEKQDQRVFRVKRKHVLKACDRCRVKKTKVGEAAEAPGLFIFTCFGLVNLLDGQSYSFMLV